MMSSETTPKIKKKPDIFFWGVLLLALILIGTYLVKNSPTAKVNLEETQESLTASVCDKTKICLNHANEAELMMLDGIGAVKSAAIVKYRETNGMFSEIEEIMLVEGIGESLFEDIKDDITI